MLPEMDLTKLTDDELIEQCTLSQDTKYLTEEAVLCYGELLKRFIVQVAASKISDRHITRMESIKEQIANTGKDEPDPNNWCILADGTTTVGEWHELDDYSYKRQGSSKNYMWGLYQNGWYGCQNGVYCFSETGAFAPLITFAQFRTLSKL